MNAIRIIVIDDLNKLNKTIKEYVKDDISLKIIQGEKIDDKIIKILHELGIPSHIKGYQYMKEGIEMIYHTPSMMDKITKSLYPELAKKFHSTTTRVERDIRHAIELGWTRANWDYMEELFGYSIDSDKAKPTNREFITTIVDRIISTKNST
jgi:two-component system response regulator (stage 0 sporulation protein A)